MLKRLCAFFAIAVLSACAPHGAVPNAVSAASSGVSSAQDAAANPSDNLKPMPGDNLKPMPGAKLGCSIVPAYGSTLCTIALNINIPPQPNPNTPPQLLSGLHPADIRAAYELPSNNAGGLVAIVDAYDNPNAEADLAVYRASMGLPACTSLNGCFKKLGQSGAASGYPMFDPAWAQEESLDLDVVSAVCPNCHIVLVEANSNSIDDLGHSVNTAATLHPIAISNSYYAFEWNGEAAKQSYFNHPGIAITAAAGDQPYVSFPAASQYVTSVGGTSLSRGGSGWWSESAWNYGGRGCSQYIAKPSWQTVAKMCTTRSAVDVAAVADPQTGVAMYSTTSGGWVVAGGTSVGAPIIAAAHALANNGRGPSYSYAHRSAFRDIAPAGYDLVTGLGSPLGVSGL